MSATHANNPAQPPAPTRTPSPRLCSAGLPAESGADLATLLNDTNCFLGTALGAFERLGHVADSHEDSDSFYAALFTLRSAAQVFAEVYELAHVQAVHPGMAERVRSRQATEAAQPQEGQQ
jgi:hypothetical protein